VDKKVGGGQHRRADVAASTAAFFFSNATGTTEYHLYHLLPSQISVRNTKTHCTIILLTPFAQTSQQSDHLTLTSGGGFGALFG
jgi:hypothetical protein